MAKKPNHRENVRQQAKGKTIESIDYKQIVFTPEQIHYVRGIVAANAEDVAEAADFLKHLGLMPGQPKWWLDEPSDIRAQRIEKNGRNTQE